ncbi:MAG: RHS repeat protein [bacterium]|nr:RHS repeat protein [bacterium]
MSTFSQLSLLRATLTLLLGITFLSSLCAAQEQFFYDDIGRLTRVSYADGTSIDYGYDSNGNRLTLTANAPVPSGGGSDGGSGCFIATAAYGSMLDPHVQDLRNFRDAYMLTNAPGRFLIRMYERYSPPIANVIAKRAWLRTITRFLLAPIVLSAAYPRTAFWLLLIFLAWRIRRRRVRAAAKLAPA